MKSVNSSVLLAESADDDFIVLEQKVKSITSDGYSKDRQLVITPTSIYIIKAASMFGKNSKDYEISIPFNNIIAISFNTLGKTKELTIHVPS